MWMCLNFVFKWLYLCKTLSQTLIPFVGSLEKCQVDKHFKIFKKKTTFSFKILNIKEIAKKQQLKMNMVCS
jgi:hypothetical protein